jgi:hypothetical protein
MSAVDHLYLVVYAHEIFLRYLLVIVRWSSRKTNVLHRETHWMSTEMRSEQHDRVRSLTYIDQRVLAGYEREE